MPDTVFQFQVNLPVAGIETYGPLFLRHGLNPEFGLGGIVLDDTPEEVFSVWAKAFQGRPVTVHGPFLDLSPGGMDPGIVRLSRSRLRRAARIAVLLGASAMVCHSGYEYRRYPHGIDRWVETAKKTWAEVLSASRGTGLTILLENVYERDPETTLRVLMETDHPRLQACFDTGHFNTWARTPLLDWLTRLKPWLKKLHLHDNDGSFDQHLPLGEGTFDFQTLFLWLKKNNLSPDITLEPHTKKRFFRTYRAFSDLMREIGGPF